jgi:Flp pilus assembly protein TadB
MYLWSILLSGSALAVALLNGRLLVGSIGLASLLIIAATALPRVWWFRRRRAARAEGRTLQVSGEAKPAPLAAPALEAKDTPA